MKIEKDISKRRFKNILQMGQQISLESKSGVRDLIKVFGRSYLYRHLALSPQHPPHGGKIPHVECSCQLLSISTAITPRGETFEDFGRKIKVQRPLQLANDIIFPWPWERRRYIRALSKIGTGKEWGKWRQDKNHHVEYWEPMGIGWVHGGNHSIMAGILSGEGIVDEYDCYDYSALYQEVSCDGVNFYNRSGEVIQEVFQPEFAVIFELGRLLLDA